MVIHLGADEEWTYTPPEAAASATVTFASASSPDRASQIVILVNNEEIDCVNLSVPHSWWPNTGQNFCPVLKSGDTLQVRSNHGATDLRLDLVQHE